MASIRATPDARQVHIKSAFIVEDSTGEESHGLGGGGELEPEATHTWPTPPLYCAFRGSDLPVLVKNTFIDIDEESPTVRRARRPRSKTEPAIVIMSAGAKDFPYNSRDFPKDEQLEATLPSVITRATVSAVKAEAAPTSSPPMTMPSPSAAILKFDSQQPHTWSATGVRPVEIAPTDYGFVQLPIVRARARSNLSLSQSFGATRVEWTVDAKKLRGSDMQVVSPSFEITLEEGMPAATFKMRIYPKTGVSRKDGASFRKSVGVGHVQLKCSYEGPASTAAHAVSIAVGSGRMSLGRRGPFRHQFAANSVFNLPKEQADWDFPTAVEHSSLTLVILVDIAPLE